jgi:hypothetical protein
VLETNEAEPAAVGDAVWPQVGAYVLLSGGLTMVFLAASTIAASPAIAVPGLLAPAVVAFGLALQRRVESSAYLGARVRWDVTALSIPFGPFVIVLAMVMAGQTRQLAADTTMFWAIALATVAELGWWGYLYPLLRDRIQPLPAALAIGLIRAGWHGMLAWAGTNPLAGASPLLVLIWSLVLALLTAAILEFQPHSIVPIVLLHLGLNAAVSVLSFAPADAGTSQPMRVGAGLLLLAGIATMIKARLEAVVRARHSKVGSPSAFSQ